MTEGNEIIERALALKARGLLAGELLHQLAARHKLAWEEEDNEAREEAIDGLWYSRKNRHEHPDGSFDGAGRWYPSDREECRCCGHIRDPSRRFPYSQIKHARSRPHITRLASESPGLFEELTGYRQQEYVLPDELRVESELDELLLVVPVPLTA